MLGVLLQAIAITHVTVLNPGDAAPLRAQTVLVRGNRIVAVAPVIPLPPHSKVLEGRGKFLIPGLWDMHVHTDVPGGRGVLALYVANGVTGVRDMGGDWDTLRSWRQAIARGVLIGPRLVVSGPYLDGNDQPIPHLLVRTPAEAVAAVDSLARLGVDFVKLHTGLTREAYFAAERAARAHQLPVAGHVPRVVGAADASDSGLASIEHLLAIPVPCTPAESVALEPRYPVQVALGRCSSRDLAPLYALLVRNHTWVTPTFSAQVEVAGWPGHSVPGDSLQHYLPAMLRKFVTRIFPMPDSIPKGADSVGRAMLARRLRQVAELQRAGVGILTGTDAPLRNSPPGFGLHEELFLLVQGGLSPAAALRAATSDAARFLGLQDSLGSIAPGKLADLVLLDANPLADIRNTRRIRAVIANGHLTPLHHEPHP